MIYQLKDKDQNELKPLYFDEILFIGLHGTDEEADKADELVDQNDINSIILLCDEIKKRVS